MEIVFLDTCILIDYFKEKESVIHTITENIKIQNCVVNDIVVMELLQGARNKNDLRFIQSELSNFQSL